MRDGQVTAVGLRLPEHAHSPGGPRSSTPRDRVGAPIDATCRGRTCRHRPSCRGTCVSALGRHPAPVKATPAAGGRHPARRRAPAPRREAECRRTLHRYLGSVPAAGIERCRSTWRRGCIFAALAVRELRSPAPGQRARRRQGRGRAALQRRHGGGGRLSLPAGFLADPSARRRSCSARSWSAASRRSAWASPRPCRRSSSGRPRRGGRRARAGGADGGPDGHSCPRPGSASHRLADAGLPRSDSWPPRAGRDIAPVGDPQTALTVSSILFGLALA